MSANLRNFTKALYGFDHVARKVSAKAWDNPTPCSKWTAREVAGHTMGVVAMVAARAEGRQPQDFMGAPGAIAGADPYKSWYEIRESTLEALDKQGVLQKELDMGPMGKQTVDQFIGFILGDTLIHTWDLAKATKGDRKLDPELVKIAFANLKPMAPRLASTGNFSEPIKVSSSASAQTKLLALSGRKV